MPPNPLTPDLAGRVLAADDKNAIEKVAAGKPLAAGARQRMEAAAIPATPSADDLARLKLNRQAALIRRWAEGGKLTPEQMAEVHPILPPELLASTPAEICSHVRTRTKFAKAYEDYAAQLNVGLRTVKRWVAVGKKAKDPCPLDDVAKIPEWWARNMSYAISPELLAICSGKPAAATNSAVGEAASSTPSAATTDASGAGAGGAKTEPPSNRQAIKVQDLASIGLKENVERLSKIHRANLELLERAFGGTSDTELQLRQRNAEKSAAMLATAQRSFDEWQKTHGELVVLADVKRDLLRVHTTMANSLVSLFVECGITREYAVDKIHGWMKQLRESRFGVGTAAELRPPLNTAA